MTLVVQGDWRRIETKERATWRLLSFKEISLEQRLDCFPVDPVARVVDRFVRRQTHRRKERLEFGHGRQATRGKQRPPCRNSPER